MTTAVDPHKRLNAVEVVDTHAVVLDRKVFAHSSAGFKELVGFARGWRRRQWAVESGRRVPYNGTASTSWGSAGEARPCVNRGGNQRKIYEGKKPKAALRCVKRRISDAIYRQMLADAHAIQRGPGGHLGGDYEDQRGRPNPDGRLFDQATARAPTAGYARHHTSVLTTEGCQCVRACC